MTFPESFLARRWQHNIIRHLIADEWAPASDQLLETQNTFSSLAATTSSTSTATTSLLASAKSIALEFKYIFSENNTKNSFVHECQMKGFLHNVESLQTYLIQYANRNLFENEKQIQFFQNISIFRFKCDQ